jgi:hypothetical protein
MSTVMVRYKVKPGRAEENAQLVRAAGARSRCRPRAALTRRLGASNECGRCIGVRRCIGLAWWGYGLYNPIHGHQGTPPQTD